MTSTRRILATAVSAIALALLPGQLTAQDHVMDAGDGASTFGEEFPHGVTFWTRREPTGCTICEPAIDINAGMFRRSGDVAEDVSEVGIRLHTQFGTGVRHVGLAVDLLWIPELTQVSPDNFTIVAQYEPIDQRKRLYMNVGFGVIAGREQEAGQNGFLPWATATLAYRGPIHDVTPFVQAGRVMSGTDRKVELYFGIAHPLTPYRMHYDLH